MKTATGHYFPNDNKQAFDLIALSFFIAISLVYTIIVGFKIIKRIQSSLFPALTRGKASDEYRLTSLGEDDDEDAREIYQRQGDELRQQLFKLRRTFHFITILSFFVLGTGLYLGSRSLSYGMNGGGSGMGHGN